MSSSENIVIKFIKGIYSMLFGAGETVENKETNRVKPLGFIAHKYESGNLGPGAIADTPGDGGGKAYGIFQLDSAFSHLNLYVKQSEYAHMFDDIKIASREFDEVWVSIANTDGDNFAESQRRYIVREYYNPAAVVAQKYNFDLTSRAIQEAIMSIAIQHGKYRLIIQAAASKLKPTSGLEDQVKALYKARKLYVGRLSSLTTRVKKALNNRYDLEEADILSLIKED